ncbi:MAG: hypothetical protein GY913_09015 [Proteobacteria bacterium]|nr:hypothetical protein [Pseudomonadota bacterium]MCP4917051.1 hypothetical protein [Pseudomonadota bacterium]
MWWLLACNGPGTDTALPESSTGSSPESSADSDLVDEERRTEGSGGGFGFRLATDGETIWTSAPWGDEARVHVLGEADPVAVGSTSFGYTLVPGPAASTPFEDDVVVWRTEPIEMLATGTMSSFEGVTTEHPLPPSDLVWWREQPVAGFARGEFALWIDGQFVGRDEPGDGAGSSLCVTDIDGDGVNELLVGAPGAGRVDVYVDGALTPFLEGTGRFGAALDCGPGRVAIGAPETEPARSGAVHVWEGDLVEALVGEPGDRLGTSVLLTGDLVYAGAPGGSAADGAVVCGLLE